MDKVFKEAKNSVLDNLDVLQVNLEFCIDQGFIDSDSSRYNELLDLIEEGRLSKIWEELEEVIVKGKSIEEDVDAWIAIHGKTSISLAWPQKP